MKIKASSFKNIIFDLGGVIVNIDYSLTTKAFYKLGLSDFDALFSQAKQSKLFDLYEKGFITSSDFRNQIRNYLGNHLDDITIDQAWNAMLMDVPKERLQLLRKIKSTHRTFLLSNTNDIHIETFNKYLQKTFGIADLSGYFEKLYLSYKVGMRKPDKEIFELVVSENNLLPQETLFIDDSIQHVEAAKTLGIHAYLLEVKKESIMDLFEM
jgi:putative hydrolase of the HAD superfamily